MKYEATMDAPGDRDRQWFTIEDATDEDSAAEGLGNEMVAQVDPAVWQNGYRCWVREVDAPETERAFDVDCDIAPTFTASEVP